MSNVVFVSNNISHWSGALIELDGNHYDNTKVPYAIELKKGIFTGSLDFTPVSGDVTWTHFRIFCEPDNCWACADSMIAAYDDSGNILFRAYKPQNSPSFNMKVRLYYTGSTYDEVTMSSPLINGAVCVVDFKWTATAGSLELKMYINSGIVVTINRASNGDSRTGVSQFTLGAPYTNDNPNGTFQYSEIMVADTDTRNARVNMLRPTGDGFSTAWIGASADLADDDPTSGLTTRLVDQDHTMDMSTYNGSDNISKVIVATLANAGENAPQNLRHILRLGGTTYEHATDVPLVDSTKYALSSFDLNPATSNPWVAANIANMEMGIRSKT